MKKNYVVKSNFVYFPDHQYKYDVFGVGLHWTSEQKRATRYTREEAIARKEYLRPACGNLRVVKLVPKKVRPWTIFCTFLPKKVVKVRP